MYRNSFINNNGNENGCDDGSDNVFAYNFWSEYRGPDLDLNGIGDLPHRILGIANNTDPHPVVPYHLLFLSIDIATAVILAVGVLKLRRIFRGKDRQGLQSGVSSD
jgi:hypothetical protein